MARRREAPALIVGLVAPLFAWLLQPQSWVPKVESDDILEIADQLGGISAAVAVVNNVVLLGVGPRIQVVDVANAADAAIIGSSDVMPDVVAAIVSDEDYAYVATSEWSGTNRQWRGGLQSLDMRDPIHPTIVGSIRIDGGVADICMQDRSAFVAVGRSGVRRVNLQDPTKPLLISTVDTRGDARRILCTDGRIWVADSEAGVHWFDTVQPTQIAQIGHVDIDGMALDVAVHGMVLFVLSLSTATQDSSISVFGIREDNSSYAIGEMRLDFPATRLRTYGDHLYASGGGSWTGGPSGGLAVYDLSSGDIPKLMGALAWPGLGDDFVVRDGLFYSVAEIGSSEFNDSPAGLRIASVRDPRKPTAIGMLATVRVIGPIKASGGMVVAAGRRSRGGTDDLLILGVDLTGTVTELGSIASIGKIRDIEIAGNFVLLLESHSPPAGDRLVIVDISDPSRPAIAVAADLGPSVRDIVLGSCTGYVASRDGVKAFRIESLPNVVLEDMIPGKNASHLAVSGSRLVLGSALSESLAEIGVYEATGTSYVKLGATTVAGAVNGIEMRDDRIYVATEPHGLYELELTLGSGLTVVNKRPTRSGASSIALGRNEIFVSDYQPWAPFGGLWRGNLGDKGEVADFIRIQLPRSQLSLSYSRGQLLGASREAGLHVFDVDEGDVRTPSPPGSCGRSTPTSQPPLTFEILLPNVSRS
jgi:hypothetical protein